MQLCYNIFMKKNYKVCPRCKSKEDLQNPKCRVCGLVFDRLKSVTNKAGKKAIRKKEYNKVLYTTDIPNDVSRLRLLLLCIFLGWSGAHFAKVGRYKWFIFDMVAFFFALLYSIVIVFFAVSRETLDASYVGLILQLLSFPFAISVIVWIGSIIQILTKKFKVPVAIDEEYFVSENDEEISSDVANEILKEVELSHKEEIAQKAQNNKKNRAKQRLFCPNCGKYVKLEKGESVCPECDEPLR